MKQYARVNETFPQETTADQFFSEEQWESYRKLGETIGAKLSQAVLAGTPGTPSQALAQLLKLRTTAQRIFRIEPVSPAPSNQPLRT